jgi:Flp pilus assembly protein TadD
MAHYNLGLALSQQVRFKEAEVEYREAIRLMPDFPEAHYNLGNDLAKQSRFKEAEAEYREAIRLKPDDAMAHNNLGKALESQRRFKEVEVEYREALRLKPDFPEAHYNLGNDLAKQSRFKEAEAEYRKAIRLKPDDPEAHINLGNALVNQGRFDKALVSLRRGHELGIKVPGWSYPSAAWVQACERLIELDRKLLSVLRSEAEPASAAERLEFAELCRYKSLDAAATRLYAIAFADEPQLAADLGEQHRYNSASAAVQAAAGQGEDARRLPDKEVIMFRRWALAWLRADLAEYGKLSRRSDTQQLQVVRQRLEQWQDDSDLASVRDKKALDQLPDDERRAWQQLWDDVDTLLKKVQEPK